jgi:hypothetical protein
VQHRAHLGHLTAHIRFQGGVEVRVGLRLVRVRVRVRVRVGVRVRVEVRVGVRVRVRVRVRPKADISRGWTAPRRSAGRTYS